MVCFAKWISIPGFTTENPTEVLLSIAVCSMLLGVKLQESGGAYGEYANVLKFRCFEEWPLFRASAIDCRRLQSLLILLGSLIVVELNRDAVAF